MAELIALAALILLRELLRECVFLKSWNFVKKKEKCVGYKNRFIQSLNYTIMDQGTSFAKKNVKCVEYKIIFIYFTKLGQPSYSKIYKRYLLIPIHKIHVGIHKFKIIPQNNYRGRCKFYNIYN
ncbi:hypothetical protein PYW07_011986 [Mythimna separata]|uniref:Secreted protein n=1 Tax=Mythimna separata TaxID=271217 RepID=A0AAD7YLF2_MYTSE|nr:hypothetical protein PYW07_011986 [Mythimna separata]